MSNGKELVAELFESVEIKIGEIKQNYKNPRIIKDKGYKQLEKSIRKNGLIPNSILLDFDNTVISGNQRLRVASEVFGNVPITVMRARKHLTKEQFDSICIVMNVSSGEWDMSTLANEFEVSELNDYGLEISFDDMYSVDIKTKETDEKEKAHECPKCHHKW